MSPDWVRAHEQLGHMKCSWAHELSLAVPVDPSQAPAQWGTYGIGVIYITQPHSECACLPTTTTGMCMKQLANQVGHLGRGGGGGGFKRNLNLSMGNKEGRKSI